MSHHQSAVSRCLACLFVCGALIGFPSPEIIRADPPPSQGVAVLNDGRVFEGSIQEVPGGYRVEYSGGSTILPFNQISMTSASLAGAYESFRDAQRNPSADSHLSLAEWCLSSGLYAQAETEVHLALKLEPLRSDAKLLLKHIDAVLHPNAVPVATTPKPQRAAFAVQTFLSPTERSGAGLTRETQLEFTTRVQPLLMNKCGNAGCHGSNVENRMQLTNVRLNSPSLRSASENNLDVLFTLMDFENAGQSLLLTKPREATPQHQKLFAGSRQQPQYQILEEWVRRVIREQQSPTEQASTTATPTRLESAQLIPTAGTQPPMASTPSSVPEVFPGIGQGSPIPGQQSKPADAQWLERIRKSNRPDAFDPEEFNRMMHSQSNQ